MNDFLFVEYRLLYYYIDNKNVSNLLWYFGYVLGIVWFIFIDRLFVLYFYILIIDIIFFIKLVLMYK